MPLALVRIDDRLIHGQVIEGWLPYLKAEEILVACDAAAQDETQAALMRLALPDTVALEVRTVASAALHPVFRGAYERKVLVLAPGPAEVLRLLEEGAVFGEVNVGGLHYSAGRVQLGKAIFLSDEDKRALLAIARRGVKLSGKALPRDQAADILGLLGVGG